MFAGIVIAGCAVLAASPSGPSGSIAGTVVNASADNVAVPRAEVVLRVRSEGDFVPLEKTLTDEYGRFEFRGLPLGSDRLYLPGANRDGIHYPGPRVQLTLLEPRAAVKLAVHDSVSSPSPLVIRKHEVALRPEPGAIRVTESLWIENPTLRCYVGQPAGENAPPVTLELGIPMDFDRATFEKEFHGRRFWVGDGKLATGIPWPPGTQEIAFTYVLPRTRSHYRWERPIDLPCSEFRLAVQSDDAGEVSCNLEPGDSERAGELVFRSSGPLSAGHRVCVEMGRLPMPLAAYGRWAALGALAVAVAAGGAAAFRRRLSRDGGCLTTSPGRSGGTSRGTRRADRRRASCRSPTR